MTAQKILTRRTFIKEALLSAVIGGSVATVITAGGEQGATGPAGPNQPGTTNALPRWTNGPGGILGDSHVSDDSSNILLSEPLILQTNAILSKLHDTGEGFEARALDTNTRTRFRIIPNGDVGIGGINANLDVFENDFTATTNFRLLRLSAVSATEFQITAVYSGLSAIPLSILNNGNYYFRFETDGNITAFARIRPNVDNSTELGQSSARWLNAYINTLLVLAASGDANPTARVTGSEIDFGPGGATATDTYLKRISAGLSETQGLRPQTDNTYDFGSQSLRFRDQYLSRAIRNGSGQIKIEADGGIFPFNDNTTKLGTSGLGFTSGFFYGQLKARSKNVLIVDGQSMTQSSHTVSNADTDIVTYSLGANSYTRVIVRVTGYVSFVTLSTNQSVNLKIKDGTTQVGNTMVVDGALSATASIPFTLEAAFVETGAVTLHFTEGAAAADANTTVFINSIVVLAES